MNTTTQHKTDEGNAPRVGIKTFRPDEIQNNSALRTGWDWCKANGYEYKARYWNLNTNVWEIHYSQG